MNVLTATALPMQLGCTPSAPAERGPASPQDEVVLGGTPDPGLIPRPANAGADAPARANGTASGWVGRNSLFVSIDQDATTANVNGTVGNAFVNLQQRQNGSSGTITGMVGNTFISLSVQRDDDSDGHRDSTVSGFVNGQFLYIRESGDARSSWITGQVGRQSLNVNRTGSPGHPWYNGFVTGVPNGSVNVSANLSDSQVPAEVFLPLLAAAN